MRKNWKKVVSLLLAASMALSMNVAAYAEEIAEVAEEAVVEEVAAENEASAPTVSEGSVSDSKVTVSNSKVASKNYQVVVTYTEKVSFNGRKHVSKAEKESKSKANDVEVTVSVCKISENGALGEDVTKDALNTAKTKVAFKNNKDAGDATFTLKLNFNKEWKKNNKDDVKTLTKAAKKKENAFTFTIEKLNLSTVSESGMKVSAKKFATKNDKLSGATLVYSVGGKDKKITLKQNAKNDANAKKAKDFFVVKLSDNKIVISTNELNKNYTGSVEVKPAKVK
ncbi:hypothetical protein SAMN06296386_105187 [Lachnospiraceae bacterium]|nr:hypothetical protein SAMN06296386_105187 [Lachnospiraceae bacterium]